MSLFKTKEWWRTECGELKESFDGQSLLVARNLYQHEDKARDVVVVASHQGYLRIYDPVNQWDPELKAPGPYKSTDLVVEAKLADAIIDLKAGKFVSGSGDTRLAILTPKKLTIYSVSFSKGSTEHGDRCSLQMAYEHQLSRFPASLTVGPFGGARNRDFLCVQCLDGSLVFYEQEVYAFSRSLKSRLLPEPLVYIAKNDVFVTLGSDWILECYRYQNIAETGRKEAAEGAEATKSIVPDWSYNIGEPIIGIESVVLSSFEVGVVVLGERTLYCLGDACTSIKTSKRLEYSALCFMAYVIEPDGKLLVIVVADTRTLMIYEGTTLKWTAQLPFAPVAVARANMQNLEGALVILSEEGRLEACYLGTEPSVFVVPQVHGRGYDYDHAEKELLEIRKLLKKSAAKEAAIPNPNLETELKVDPTVSPELLPSPYQKLHSDDNEESESRPQASMCKITVELTAYLPLQDIQVVIDAPRPFVITNSHLWLDNLCEKHTMETMVYLEEELVPSTSEVTITACYETEQGEDGVIQKTVQVPIRMLIKPCAPENTALFSINIKCTEPVLNFSQIFPEFIGEYTTRQTTNSLGLQHAQSGQIVTVATGLMMNRYRVQSNDPGALALVVQQLLLRLKDKAPKVSSKLTSSVSQQHLHSMQAKIDLHFDARLKIKAAMKEIGLLTTQLRNIEKRMLRGMRERNSRSLATSGLPDLLEFTYEAIYKQLDLLQAAQEERERTVHNLQASLRLVILLLHLAGNQEMCNFLESAIRFAPQLREKGDWEEMTDYTLVTINRALSKGQDMDSCLPNSFNRFETKDDLAKLKKHLAQLVDKLAALDRGPPAVQAASALDKSAVAALEPRPHSTIEEDAESKPD